MLRVDYDDPDLKVVLIDGGGVEVFHYKGTPFTGVVEYSRHPDGSVAEELQYVKGYMEGFSRAYFPNGQLEQEVFYKYNRMYGHMKIWDQNGSLIEQYDNWPEPE
jgi:hypothetical protein